MTSTHSSTSTLSKSVSTGFRAGVLVITFVCLLWFLELLDVILPIELDQFGIVSRDFAAIPGILAAPLLHHGLGHVAANSIPFLILGFLVAARGIGVFLAMSVFIACVSGAGVWLIGPSNTVTVGASGLIFGYFGYLVGRGIFDRRITDIVITVVVVSVYGSLIWTVLPGDPRISWQAHLFGLIGGLTAAWLLRRNTPPRTPQRITPMR